MKRAVDTLEKMVRNESRERRLIHKNTFYQGVNGQLIFVMNFAETPNGETLVIYHEMENIQAVYAEPIERFSERTESGAFRFVRMKDLKGMELLEDVLG